MSNRPPNLTEKLAATLLEVQRLRGNPIDRDTAKRLTASQICSLFHFDHWPIRREMGGSCHPTNLDPKLIRDHRFKTAKFDQPEMAHNRAVSEAVINHLRKMQAKVDKAPAKDKRSSRWPKRAMFTPRQQEIMKQVRAERRLKRKGQ